MKYLKQRNNFVSKLKIKNWFCSITQTKPILAITKDDYYLQNPQKQAMVMALEREIDRMVYQLYLPAPQRGASRQAGGLTDEEIQIVEGSTK